MGVAAFIMACIATIAWAVSAEMLADLMGKLREDHPTVRFWGWISLSCCAVAASLWFVLFFGAGI